MSAAQFSEQYTGSPRLKVLRQRGDVRLTQHIGHEDYAVWTGGRVHAVGGETLMLKVFEEIAPKGEAHD